MEMSTLNQHVKLVKAALKQDVQVRHENGHTEVVNGYEAIGNIWKNFWNLYDIQKISFFGNNLRIVPMTPNCFRKELCDVSDDYAKNHKMTNFWVLEDFSACKVICVFRHIILVEEYFRS